MSVRDMPVRNVATLVRPESDDGLRPPLVKTGAQMKAQQCQKLGELKTVLLDCGFTTLAQQAAALGLCRSSAWKLLKSDHKHSGLSAALVKRMLASRDLPHEARMIIDAYVQEKLRGAYGHGAAALKRFRLKLRDYNADGDKIKIASG